MGKYWANPNEPFDLGMIVTVEVGPDGRVGVEILFAVDIAQHRALAFDNDDRLALEPVAHLRERMPDELVIELGEANSVTLTWGSLAGRTYRVRYKDNLSDPMWSSLPGDVTATGTTAIKSDVISGPQRFYWISSIR